MTLTIQIPKMDIQQHIVELEKKLELTKPDAARHNPAPDYLRQLVDKTGLSQRACAKAIGVSERTFRDYLNSSHESECPYPVQFALEMLALHTPPCND